MARFTNEALIKVKKLFDNREFILSNDKIYKKIKYSSQITIDCDDEAITVSVRSLIVYYSNTKNKKNISKQHEKAIIYFSNLINSGKYIIDYNELYKRYGYKLKRGYTTFVIAIDNVIYRTFEHRIIYYLYFGIWDDLLVIHHRDSNKSNNKIQNLELVTNFENLIYSIRNYEAFIHPSNLDEDIRNKYRLHGEEWEIFKNEVIKAYEHNDKGSYYIRKER